MESQIDDREKYWNNIPKKTFWPDEGKNEMPEIVLKLPVIQVKS